MRKKAATIAVLAGGAFCLVSVFGIVAAQVGRPRQLNEPVASPNPYNPYANVPPQFQQAQPPGPQAGPRSLVDPNEERMVVTEPNEIRLKLRSFQGLEQQINQVIGGAQEEREEWLPRGGQEDRLALMDAIRAQLRAELRFLRQIALEEKAQRTVAALDGLLLSRQERFIDISSELEEEEQRLRLQAQQQGPGLQNQPMGRGRRGVRAPTQPLPGTAPGQGNMVPRSGGRRRRR